MTPLPTERRLVVRQVANVTAWRSRTRQSSDNCRLSEFWRIQLPQSHGCSRRNAGRAAQLTLATTDLQSVFSANGLCPKKVAGTLLVLITLALLRQREGSSHLFLGKAV